MIAQDASDPDPARPIIYVGQDRAGHWLVQDNTKRLEGRFISYDAAMRYARAEGDTYHADVAVACGPLTPCTVSSTLAALPRAA